MHEEGWKGEGGDKDNGGSKCARGDVRRGRSSGSGSGALGQRRRRASPPPKKEGCGGGQDKEKGEHVCLGVQGGRGEGGKTRGSKGATGGGDVLRRGRRLLRRRQSGTRAGSAPRPADERVRPNKRDGGGADKDKGERVCLAVQEGMGRGEDRDKKGRAAATRALGQRRPRRADEPFPLKKQGQRTHRVERVGAEVDELGVGGDLCGGWSIGR